MPFQEGFEAAREKYSRNFYHATTEERAESIKNEGFKTGVKGLAGPWVYLCKNANAALKKCK